MSSLNYDLNIEEEQAVKSASLGLRRLLISLGGETQVLDSPSHITAKSIEEQKAAKGLLRIPEWDFIRVGKDLQNFHSRVVCYKYQIDSMTRSIEVLQGTVS